MYRINTGGKCVFTTLIKRIESEASCLSTVSRRSRFVPLTGPRSVGPNTRENPFSGDPTRKSLCSRVHLLLRERRDR